MKLKSVLNADWIKTQNKSLYSTFLKGTESVINAPTSYTGEDVNH